MMVKKLNTSLLRLDLETVQVTKEQVGIEC